MEIRCSQYPFPFCYSLHQKDGEGTVFTGVCLSIPRMGTPSPSHNTSTGPMSFLGVNPVTSPSSPLGVPQSQAGRCPSSRWGTHPRCGGTQVPGGCASPVRTELGYPLAKTGLGYPPRLKTRESTWYAAGGMPLAFMLEDFLADELQELL